MVTKNRRSLVIGFSALSVGLSMACASTDNATAPDEDAGLEVGGMPGTGGRQAGSTEGTGGQGYSSGVGGAGAMGSGGERSTGGASATGGSSVM